MKLQGLDNFIILYEMITMSGWDGHDMHMVHAFILMFSVYGKHILSCSPYISLVVL